MQAFKLAGIFAKTLFQMICIFTKHEPQETTCGANQSPQLTGDEGHKATNLGVSLLRLP